MHKNKLKWVAVIVIVTVFIAIQIAADLKCLKGVIDLQKLPGKDKAAHFVLMGLFAAGLTIFLSGALFKVLSIPVPKGAALAALLVTLEETSQIWVPGRTFSGADLTASLAGVVVFSAIACACCTFIFRNNPRKIPE